VILYDDQGTADQYNSATDEIKYSWLIWNVDYSPIPEYGTGSSTTALNNAKGRWMDRNLGATINNVSGSDLPEDAKVYGFLYEWGRPHPLNHARYGINTSENLYVYDNGTSVSKPLASADADAITDVTINTWVKNPIIYYHHGGDNSGLTTRNDNLWSPAIKTVYDPCPPNWRVPADMSAWDITDFTYTSIKGSDAPLHGGYYPHAGRINVDNYFAVNERGQHWTCSIAQPDGFPLLKYSLDTSENYTDLRNLDENDQALSIRCVAIQ
jgi:hypothetical protein